MNTLRFRLSTCLLAAVVAGWGAGAASAQVCDDTTRQNYATDVSNGFTQAQLDSKYAFCRTTSTVITFNDEAGGYVNVAQAIKEIKAGKVEFRVDKAGIIHAPVGKASFPAQSLIENAHALLGSLLRAKPAAAKAASSNEVQLVP